MSAPEPAAVHPLTPREILRTHLEEILPGPGHERDRWLLLTDADHYAAWMGEEIARPPEHNWGPR